jgi:hypothetical protein
MESARESKEECEYGIPTWAEKQSIYDLYQPVEDKKRLKKRVMEYVLLCVYSSTDPSLKVDAHLFNDVDEADAFLNEYPAEETLGVTEDLKSVKCSICFEVYDGELWIVVRRVVYPDSFWYLEVLDASNQAHTAISTFDRYSESYHSPFCCGKCEKFVVFDQEAARQQETSYRDCTMAYLSKGLNKNQIVESYSVYRARSHGGFQESCGDKRKRREVEIIDLTGVEDERANPAKVPRTEDDNERGDLVMYIQNEEGEPSGSEDEDGYATGDEGDDNGTRDVMTPYDPFKVLKEQGSELDPYTRDVLGGIYDRWLVPFEEGKKFIKVLWYTVACSPGFHSELLRQDTFVIPEDLVPDIYIRRLGRIQNSSLHMASRPSVTPRTCGMDAEEFRIISECLFADPDVTFTREHFKERAKSNVMIGVWRDYAVRANMNCDRCVGGAIFRIFSVCDFSHTTLSSSACVSK